MFGSIFYNLWAALIAFSVYFFMTFQSSYTPVRILIGSFVSAILVFLAMFLVRFFVSFILFTPEKEENLTEDELGDTVQDEGSLEKNQEKQTVNSTVEFQDENTEEIAQVVRTMMHRDEEQVNI